MSLISWRRITLSLEDVSQMASAIAANNLCSLHTKGAISVSSDRPWNGIEICGPTTAALEFVFRLVQGSIAAGAGVYALLGHMLVVFTSVWCFGTLLT